MVGLNKAKDEVLNRQDFNKADSEEEILKFWEKNEIYRKVREKNKGKKKFYLMDGPPYATGHIHMGTALNKIMKDIVIRVKGLQGYDVFDRPGYDTHGLPIEFQVEKEIGSKSKKDIEKYGVKKFIERCKDYATMYIDDMNEDFKNLGVWMNWDNPYLTLQNEYIGAVWDVLKKGYEKKLLYLGKYPIHSCPRCETAVAYNEIEYGKIEDNSIYVKFPVKNQKDRYFIIWTTTPWTLPGNAGIMVHPDFDYQEIEIKGERWIIAKELINEIAGVLEERYRVVDEFKGKKLEGIEYESPLKDDISLKIENGMRILLSGRYVTLDEGTGLVHCAPGHGKEDYEVGRENGLDSPCPVGIDGKMTKEAGKYAGKKARDVNQEIIEDLEKNNFLVLKKKHKHDYPLCWRCKTPLLLVSLPQWFLKISEIHSKLLKENEKVNWVPDYMKSRMNAWIEGIGDWPISRERYWGTPLPIWVSGDGDQIVVGSKEELERLSGKEIIELHKPEIDNIVIKKNGKKYKRISAVLDVWFDSGVTSWAALGYPADKKKFDKIWPADLNIEGKDQFRGWWNSQLILSVIGFDKKPYNNIAVHGMVLDISKTKMSKSLGNAVSPKYVINKFGRDFMRYYFAKSSKGDDFAYNERDFKDVSNMFRVLTNVNNFINQLGDSKKDRKIEDSWIISRYNRTIKEVCESYNKYKFYEAVYRLEKFLIEDISRKYIQIVRNRANEVKKILEEMMIGVLKMLAPVSPFVTESIWQEMRKSKKVGEESLFLSEWPKSNEKNLDDKLEEEFGYAEKIIEIGLRERDKEGIGLRWPLSKVMIKWDVNLRDEIKKIILKQLNVKEIVIEKSKGKDLEVKLEFELTPELENEGFAREIARRVQAERKKKGLKKEDIIKLKLSVGSELEKRLEKWKDFIKERTGSESVDIVDKKKGMIEFEVRGKKITIGF